MRVLLLADDTQNATCANSCAVRQFEYVHIKSILPYTIKQVLLKQSLLFLPVFLVYLDKTCFRALIIRKGFFA